MATQLKHLMGYAVPTTNVTLVADKLEEWDIFQRFLEHNPEIKEQYLVYKTYEILKNNDH